MDGGRKDRLAPSWSWGGAGMTNSNLESDFFDLRRLICSELRIKALSGKEAWLCSRLAPHLTSDICIALDVNRITETTRH